MNGNAEKCASCNQYLNQGDEDCKHMQNNHNKYKFRSIQDSSNKYKTGSYSRMLSNIDSEELKQKSVNLPDISIFFGLLFYHIL